MTGLAKIAWMVPVALLLLVKPAAGQLKFGELSTSGTAILSPGFSASYGNMTGSTHNWTVGGAGSFSGSYYTPNFLSYNASVYLNQSRANSNFQSISDASGVNLSANIFAGSHFPGSINYSKAYNSEGNYAIPGISNYVTHGNSDTFGINWSENLPDAPSFSAGFQFGSSNYSVYGTNDTGDNSFHSLNLHSSYLVEGFNMGAYYDRGGSQAMIPQVVSGHATTETKSNSDNYGFNLSHLLPLQGSASASINRSSWSSDYLGYHTSGTIDTINSLAAIHPFQRAAFTFNANYSDNLSGQLLQSVINAGGVAPTLSPDQTSDSLDLIGVATYTPAVNLQTSAFVERRTQHYLGVEYGVTSYGGGATYARKLLDGTFNSALTITANSADNTGVDTLGFSTSENYSNVLLGWHLTGSFGYAQNVQTLLVTYMNSFYNFSGSARRNWGRFNVSAGAGGSRTGLTEVPGTVSTSQTYTGSTGFGVWLTGNGSYSKSSGLAIITGAGLVPVPIPSPVVPSGLVSLYGGESYSFGVSSTPVRRLIMAAAYAHATSNTLSDSVSSNNENSEFQTLIQYQFRKLNFTSGYSRLQQGFSQTGTQPEVISSYFIGLSRWFNFF